MTIGKRFVFEAAHRLPRHDGKCSRKHGHSYTVEVDVTGPIKTASTPDQGMVLDYAVIKKIVNDNVLDRFDHQDINAVLDAEDKWNVCEINNVTTAEFLASYIARVLSRKINDGSVTVTRVRVCETQSSWAEWRPDAAL